MNKGVFVKCADCCSKLLSLISIAVLKIICVQRRMRSKNMTRFRHDLILRMIKLLDAVLVTIPFAMCWYLYYAKRVASPYYAKGDYLVVALFFVLFIIFGRVYDAFLMSMLWKVTSWSLSGFW